MKILHTVEFYPPSIGGMQEVVKQLSERIAKLGHDMTVATTRLPSRTEQTINGVKILEFTITGNLARGFSGEIERYRQYLLDSKFDVITNFAAQQWATDGMITLLDRIHAKKVFVPTGFSGLHQRKYHDYFENMAGWMKQYDMNVFLSETYRDADFAVQHGIKNRTLIPNGASEDEFLPETQIDIRSRLRIPDDHFAVLHVGSHTGIKGHREAFKIFEKARIRNATLLIVANDFGGGCRRECGMRKFLFSKLPWRRSDGKQVIVTSLSRPETIAAFKSADLFLFPSNVECSPLVLFECMASKTPFLTTDVGNAREIVAWSQAGSVLPTRVTQNGISQAYIDGSVRMLEHMHSEPALREKMREQGFQAWQERFTWGRIAGEYERLYHSLTEGAGHEHDPLP